MYVCMYVCMSLILEFFSSDDSFVAAAASLSISSQSPFCSLPTKLFSAAPLGFESHSLQPDNLAIIEMVLQVAQALHHSRLFVSH